MATTTVNGVKYYRGPTATGEYNSKDSTKHLLYTNAGYYNEGDLQSFLDQGYIGRGDGSSNGKIAYTYIYNPQTKQALRVKPGSGTTVATRAGGTATLVSPTGNTSTFTSGPTQGSSGTTAPTGIQSVVLTLPDGTNKRVAVGSDAYDKYIAMGAQETGAKMEYDEGGAPIQNKQNQQNQKDQQQDIITDPVTGNQYIKGAGGTYEPYTSGAGTAPTSGYTGPSIVDYLDSVGQASDFSTRATLAKQYGISNYTGTAAQNTQLLNTLRSQNPQQPVQQAQAPMGSSAPQTGNYTSSQAPAPVDINDVFASYGVNMDIEGFMKNPVASFEDTYDQLYKNLGISELKKEASKLLSQATKYDEEYADAVTGINDDPWLTEGVRIARIRKEEERRDLKKAGVLNTLAIYDKTIDSLTDQARFLVKGAYDQYNADRNFTQDMIGFIYDRVDKANQARADMAEYEDKKAQQEFENALALENLALNQYKAQQDASSGGVGGMFSAAQINSTVNQIAGAFDNEQIVKDYNNISQSLAAVRSAGTSPTDDIQRVYAFAKIMDPNSVVREGEYNTIEKYAQAVIQHAGLKAVRVFSNQGFLTTEARNLMQNTLENRFRATESAYNNVYNQYQSRIDAAKAGQGNTLTDYSSNFASQPIQQQQTILDEAVNAGVDIGGYEGFWGKVGALFGF